MSTESLQLAIEEAQAQLDGRESRRMIAWVIITSLLFFVRLWCCFSSFQRRVLSATVMHRC